MGECLIDLLQQLQPLVGGFQIAVPDRVAELGDLRSPAGRRPSCGSAVETAFRGVLLEAATKSSAGVVRSGIFDRSVTLSYSPARACSTSETAYRRAWTRSGTSRATLAGETS